MAWETFFHVGRRGRFDSVSVVGGKILTISKSLADRVQIGRYQHVKLCYDVELQKIGLKLLSIREPGTAPIHHGLTTCISASVFIRYLGVPNGRYSAEWDENQEMLVCRFDQDVEERSSSDEARNAA